MADPNKLKLSVTNFGPIAKAEIDLRPLTVFIGPSNTGKSYLAVLIYALHRFFSGASFGLPFRSSVWGRTERDLDMSDEEIDALIEWARRDDSALETIAPLIRRRLGDINSFAFGVYEEITRCFGIEDTKGIIRHGIRKPARVELGWQRSSDSESFGYKFTMKRGGVEHEASIPDTMLRGYEYSAASYMSRIARLDSPDEYEGRLRDLVRKEVAASVMNHLSDTFGSQIVMPLSDFAYYLPASRTGIMHAHRVVVASLIDRAPRAGFDQAPTEPTLSGVLADFLRQLVEIDDSRPLGTRQLYPREILSERLEKEMLRGKIITEHSDIVRYPEFHYQPDGWQDSIPLKNSSSMVSELAPVILYLRNVVRRGNVLIIEEPESHLHPALQVEFIRQLAAAVNLGIRVMLTTHSEWVLEELANLIRLSDLPENQRKMFDAPDSALTPDQLGMWLFESKLSPKGTVVKEIPLDLEIGNFPSGYDDVATKTYNKWAQISNTLEYMRTR